MLDHDRHDESPAAAAVDSPRILKPRIARMLAACLALAAFSFWATAWGETLPLAAMAREFAEVRGMDFYPDGAALHALLVARTRVEGPVGVFYLFSRDGGKSWSKPSAIDRENEPEAISRRGDDAQIAARGKRLVAVWRARGEFPNGGPLAVAYSEDGGASWARGANPALGDATSNQAYPDLAADAEGRFHLTWLDDREENGDSQGLRHAWSTDGGRHWAREITVDGKACTCCWNRLIPLSRQGIALLYRDVNPHDMRLARSLSGGEGWRIMDRAVGDFDWRFSGCPHCGGGLAQAGEGASIRLHSVIWTGNDAAPGLYYLNSGNLGESWSKPLRLGDEHDREADIAAASKRDLAVTYTQESREGAFVAWLRTRDGGKTWTRPVRLSNPEAKADHPRVFSRDRGFAVFWTERRGGGGRRLAAAFLP
jgi:photosystem II stability/assembly factor-like uncharacterized protein